MAHIHEEHVVIKVSKLVRTGETAEITTADIRSAIENVVGELYTEIAGGGIVVEAVDMSDLG